MGVWIVLCCSGVGVAKDLQKTPKAISDTSRVIDTAVRVIEIAQKINKVVVFVVHVDGVVRVDSTQ